jgi:hypothetical protein
MTARLTSGPWASPLWCGRSISVPSPELHLLTPRMQEMAEMQPPRYSVHPMRVIFMVRPPCLVSFHHTTRVVVTCRVPADFARAAAQARQAGGVVQRPA